jgi:hypothetical protein
MQTADAPLWQQINKSNRQHRTNRDVVKLTMTLSAAWNVELYSLTRVFTWDSSLTCTPFVNAKI